MQHSRRRISWKIRKVQDEKKKTKNFGRATIGANDFDRRKKREYLSESGANDESRRNNKNQPDIFLLFLFRPRARQRRLGTVTTTLTATALERFSSRKEGSTCVSHCRLDRK